MDVQAMHIANGIVNGTVSAIFAVFAAVVLAFCGWRARADLDDRLAVPAYRVLGAEGAARLAELARPLSRTLVKAGFLAAATPRQ